MDIQKLGCGLLEDLKLLLVNETTCSRQNFCKET